ncbi:hypothetical protein AJ79_09430 [Helicocarpus griseus UAMH5409]|uniref:Aminoglycoside phosphotransferase domain-containing protein n=1 Tax=Helicocarpus griseus UAMH5409 TaxID=1447875 RepID=A0A2B7WK00_9EURO|nr:hypothetical protein AJ79_09430 [Helicocarpus griseus UAMH5409]
MWQPVALPFENCRLPPDLPPLPTPDEARACPNVLWDRRGKVVAVNDRIVVKFGKMVNPWEGQSLIYLEQHVPDIPAPRLYAMYYDSNQFFLVMQRAPGVSLDKTWPSLTVSEKGDIIAKLQHVFSIMRQAKSPWPDTFFGSLDGGPVHHYLFWSMTHGRHMGPFHSEAAFVSAITTNYRLASDRKGWPRHKADYYEKYLPHILRGHRPTLTHGDVQQKNIVVVPKGLNAQGSRSFDVVLVDWESASWCPGFWEIFCAVSTPLFASCVWEDDWCWQIHEFLEAYPAETSIMSLLNRDWL